MPIQIYKFDLLDLAGNIEQSKYMTEAEAKEANTLLWERQERLIRWAKSYKQ